MTGTGTFERMLAFQMMYNAWKESFNRCSLGELSKEAFGKVIPMDRLEIVSFEDQVNEKDNYIYYTYRIHCRLQVSDGYTLIKFFQTSIPTVKIDTTNAVIEKGETKWTSIFNVPNGLCILDVVINNHNSN